MESTPIDPSRSSWSSWAGFLRRHGLENLAIFLLESAGPLSVLGAQALYLGSPFLRPALSDSQQEALASLLEDPAEARAFANFLRKETIL